MSTSIRIEIRVIPAQVKVIEHVQHVYACRACERTGIRTPVVTAPMPKPPIPGSYASPSAIASVIHNKYVQGIPLYRQEQEFSRLGVGLSRQTLANQTLEATERHPVPIYERLHTELLKGDIIQADETTVQVLRKLGRTAEMRSYMWLYRSGRDGPPMCCLTIDKPAPARSRKHPAEILAGFSGCLKVDGHAGYGRIPNVTLIGCWAHARRGFVDALAILPKESRSGATCAPAIGVEYCNRLFEIERELKERKAERPMLVTQVTPKSVLGKAVAYCLNE